LQIVLEQFAVAVSEQFVEARGVEFLVGLVRRAAYEVAVIISFEFACHNCLPTGYAKGEAGRGHNIQVSMGDWFRWENTNDCDKNLKIAWILHFATLRSE